ncbi:uncharacterized protein [Littorina saxatilis]|uniref:C2H2-type domain-containing protein n=1 Tax=Littorina saxatilis TaxID=31220 RepID=A0AAN9C2U7_9CAEN
MMGCQPQASPRSHRSHASYSLAHTQPHPSPTAGQHSDTHLQHTVSSGDSHLQYTVSSRDSHLQHSVSSADGRQLHTVSTGQYSEQKPQYPSHGSLAPPQAGSQRLSQDTHHRTDPQVFYPPASSATSSAAQGRYRQYSHPDVVVQQQRQRSETVTSRHQLPSWSVPQQQGAQDQERASESVRQTQPFASQWLQFSPTGRTAEYQLKCEQQQQHQFVAVGTVQQQHKSGRSPAETATSGQLAGRSSEVASLQPPQPAFSVSSPSRLTETAASQQHFPPQSETGTLGFRQGTPPHTQYSQLPSSPLHQQQQQQQQQQYYQLSPSASATMLDKKPTLQVVTTDHSPISPGSSTNSPRFIFPDMSGHHGSDSGSSPFMSPIKREIKWEVGTPPLVSELEGAHQMPRERVRMHSGDTEHSETLVDSETGSSVLEDSSSSREQSPFSAMAESLSLRSPSEHSPSPLTRKVFQRQTVTVTSEDDEQGEEGEGGPGGALGSGEEDFHPSKFKKRLHERYVMSLKDAPAMQRRVKEEYVERYEEGEGGHVDSKRPVSKMERPDSPCNPDSPMPKSPRRSSSDTDIVRTESTEMGASSADEGDVFMEPTMRVRAKHKPPSLHQREPLDLSRGPYYPGFRSSSGSMSSPLVDTEHLSPASKVFSPVFRSPRLPYSPHGMLSPQSQSPLCSVPEGGRIFNFNMPSPLEGAHSDSDLISPSPMSPRIFTFPPQGTILNPMSEVNRLAVSPRAPYTPPPPMIHSKGLSMGNMVDIKWGEQHGFYGKRSLSESDMTYLCPVCNQVFPTNDNLAKHMAKHLPTETVRTGDSNKVHYCKVCNRSFSRSDMLTRHMRLHTGLKPYECMECGQVFSRSDHLNTHRRTHTGEKPYRCPHCPYAACRRDMITRHMRTHAKRSSRRARYLSVPDDGDQPKGSGSISSTETTDSQDFSTGRHTCSISSVDSVESESVHSSRKSYMGTSVDSLLSAAHSAHSTSSSRKPSEELEEGEEVGRGYEGGSQFDRFMRYRKSRNWSATSLESVDSEEALIIREALVDEAFHEIDFPGESEGRDRGGKSVPRASHGQKDVTGLDTKTLQKCFISPQPPGSGSSSTSS